MLPRGPVMGRMTFVRRRSPLLVALVAAVVAVGGCFLPLPFGDEGAAPIGSPEPGWRNCGNEANDLVGRAPSGFSFECRDVAVPQDWNNPDNGKTFNIAVIRARSTDQTDKIGSLVVNPGGPGGSGFDLAVYLTLSLPEEITERFDVVGFDPRGVSRSEGLDCYSDADLDASFGYDPDPATQESFDGLVKLTDKMVDGCAAKYGDTLPLFSTEQAAHDMDAVREAVGDDKLTYLGYSYGTLLGATYAQLHPDKIRALVLDGAVDPKLNSVASSESQAMGFERAFDNFAAWCADTPSRCKLDGDARAVVSKLIEDADAKPVSYRGRQATGGWIFWGIVSSLYDQSRWPDLADALADLSDGQAQGIFALADAYADRDPGGEYTNLFDANAAVNCSDDGSPPSVDQVRKLQGEWRQKYPLFGSSLAVGLLTCTLWDAKRDPYPTGQAAGAPPILVVGTKGDPATPYENTAKLAGMLGVGQVLTWDGEGHTAYPATRCITDAVNGYLIDLTMPAKNKVCPAK
jgi:pimeloyl-ACP methyl ester carboxylesterase